MNPIRSAVLKLRALFGRRGLERDMQREINEHLKLAEQRLIARGLTPADARAEARREFGILSVIEEEGRDARGTRFIESLLADVGFALRYFSRKPLMAATIVLVLALGIGANTGIVSMIQAFSTRPAPGVSRDLHHMKIHGLEQPSKGARWRLRALSLPEVNELAQRREAFAAVGAWSDVEVIVDRESRDAPRALNAHFVSAGYWNALGVRFAGPGYSAPIPDVADMAAILSFNLAEELLGSAEGAIGKTILVGDMPVRVAGVAPPRFEGAEVDRGRPKLWLPISARITIARSTPNWAEASTFETFARLAPGVSQAQASGVARAVVARLQPESLTVAGVSRSADVLPMPGPLPVMIPDDRYIAFGMMGLVSLLILLVACTNVSSLLVAAAVGRQHEIAVRLSMGAPRSRVLRQLVTESSILALAGGGLGLLLLWWFTAWVGSRLNMELTPDALTVAITAGIALGTGVLFGLSPALHATKAGVASTLRESGIGATSRSRLQGIFVAAQIVFSQPLLLMLGLVLYTMVGERTGQPSQDVSDRVIRARFRGADVGAERRFAGLDTLRVRMMIQPGITSVVPEASGFALRTVGNEQMDPVQVRLEGAAPGYFGLLEVPIILGRDVAWSDTSSTEHAIVIGSDLAREFFGDLNPIGQRLTSAEMVRGVRDSLAMVVVGVFDATHPTTREGGRRVFTATGKRWRRDVLLIRTAAPALPYSQALQKYLRATAPNLPVLEFATLTQIAAQELRVAKQVSAATVAAGALALGLASIGLFAVVALAVGQKRREIGIRIALGGRPTSVARSFFMSGLRLCLIGVGIGLPVSMAAMKFLMSVEVILLPEINMTLVGASVCGVMLVVACVATWFPARKAATVDPCLALRSE